MKALHCMSALDCVHLHRQSRCTLELCPALGSFHLDGAQMAFEDTLSERFPRSKSPSPPTRNTGSVWSGRPRLRAAARHAHSMRTIGAPLMASPSSCPAHPSRSRFKLRVLGVLMVLGAGPTPALAASPDCSNAGVHPSPACVAKLEYCNHTAIVTVLAVRAREAGTAEGASVATLSANTTHEAWYEKNRAVIKDIVHQVHSNDAAYAKLKETIGPLMALGIPTLANGCSADTSVTVEQR